MNSSLFQHYSEQFSRMRPSLPEAEVRDKALRQLQHQGFPAPRDEAWRDTDLNALLGTGFIAAPEPGAEAMATAETVIQQSLLPELLPGAINLVLVNGWYMASLSATENMPGSIQVEPGFCQETYDRSSFALLGNVFAGRGLTIAVRGKLQQPLHLVYVNTGALVPLLYCPRVAVNLDARASVEIVESHLAATADDNGFSNSMLQLDLAEASSATCISMQFHNAPRHQLHMLRARQLAESRLMAVVAGTGSDCARRELDVLMEGRQSSCELRGLYLLGGRKQMDFRTRVTHASADSSSEQLVLGLLRDKARSMFHGHVVIARDAQQVEAHQKNENLVLNHGATAGAQPMLEIHADDVKCSHGASVGNLDKDAVFSLRSRGLDKAAAEQLLAEAFLNRVLEAVEREPLRCHMQDKLVMDRC